MNYKNYQNARDAAWRLLIDCRIDRLPISVTGICRELGITVKLYEPTDGSDGQSYILGERPTILVAVNKPKQRQRFTAAHELGHIILGHVGKYELVNREPDPQEDPIEREANIFASRLLAPACVLWGCGARTPEEIAELCDISLQAAKFRAERMEVLYQRNKFLTSPLERQVYVQFRDYIRDNRL